MFMIFDYLKAYQYFYQQNLKLFNKHDTWHPTNGFMDSVLNLAKTVNKSRKKNLNDFSRPVNCFNFVLKFLVWKSLCHVD